MKRGPQFPVYVISKGRSDCCMTADGLLKDKVPFKIVIEPQELDAYAEKYDKKILLVLPFSNLGLGSIPARNWVWEHSKKAGFERHWILDDNLREWYCVYRGKRIRCNAGLALFMAEEFTRRYSNIGIAGLNYTMFCIPKAIKGHPFYLNVHVYSCLLILNELPFRWRGRYNEDTDLCLQVLSAGWCTVLLNMFNCHKMQTMTMKGGNSAQLYRGDGRLTMARSLERVWPYVVETHRRFGRPQHVVRNQWKGFDTQLKLKPGVKFDKKPNSFGMKLVKLKDIRSSEIRTLYESQ